MLVVAVVDSTREIGGTEIYRWFFSTFSRVGFIKLAKITWHQWRIQDVPDSDANPQGWVANRVFGYFLPKTAWKLRQFGREGACVFAPPSLNPLLASHLPLCPESPFSVTEILHRLQVNREFEQ